MVGELLRESLIKGGMYITSSQKVNEAALIV
jgi:hypothetical protein